MTGIENITGRIQADAQAEIDKIQADARREAEKISAGYAARADRECAELLARGETSARERGERLVSAAEMESRKMTLGAKQEVLDQAFDLALEKLLSLPQADYVALLAKLAASAAPAGPAQIMLNQTDREKLGSQVVAQANQLLAKAGSSAKLSLSEQTRPIRGGLLVSDGAVEVNCALETLVRLSRSEATGEVSRLLFP